MFVAEIFVRLASSSVAICHAMPIIATGWVWML